MPLLRDESMAEFTARAVCTGILLGVIFGAANAYLGLRVGLTVSASIPAAVMTVALFRLLRRKATILEANLSQTVGSASTSLASGTIFTIPALFMWGLAPPYLQVVALCFLGGALGIAAMIPLRKLLIVGSSEELPYPEGRACAEVLRATATSEGGSAWIFRGMAAGALIKLSLSLLFLSPGSLSMAIPVLQKAELAVEIAPALLGVGFILGYRQSAVIVAGSIVSATVLTPLISWIGSASTGAVPPEPTLPISAMDASQIWSRYVRFIGAGAVATAGILTVLKNLPSMIDAVRSVGRGLTDASRARGSAPATTVASDRDLPPEFVAGAVLMVIAVAAFVPGVFASDMGWLQRLVCGLGVGVFGLLFVAVAARIVGLVGVTSQPTSGITLITLLGVASAFAAFGWREPAARAAVLTVGTIVAVAASKAGDISQDLKTGYLVGATPAKQQFGQLLGAAVACWVVAGTVLMLGEAYSFGSKEMPAPQATLMKTVIEGVLSGDLPWGLVLTGGGIAISAMLCGVSGLAFAIGVYLPLASMMAIYLGGCARALVERGRASGGVEQGNPGVLAAAGLVAGEGLAGVLVAGLVAVGAVGKSMPTLLPGFGGTILSMMMLLAVGGLLFQAGRGKPV